MSCTRGAGTPAAVRELVRVATGREADLEESGGTMWSEAPETSLPGSAVPGLVVRVHRAATDGEPASTRRC